MKKFSLGQEQVENIFFASVPRSGSTWMRRLLEYSTNISTETFYLGEVPDNDRNGRPIDENSDQSWLRSQFDTKGSCEHIIYDGGGRNNRLDSIAVCGSTVFTILNSGLCSTTPPLARASNDPVCAT
jgi:hypothetical protein